MSYIDLETFIIEADNIREICLDDIRVIFDAPLGYTIDDRTARFVAVSQCINKAKAALEALQRRLEPSIPLRGTGTAKITLGGD